MACIYSRNGILWIKFYTVSGKQVRQSLKLKDDREGRNQAKMAQKKIEADLAIDPIGVLSRMSKTKTNVSELWKQFQQEEGRNKKASTLSFYALGVKKFIQYAGDLPVGAVTKQDIFDLRDKMRAAEGDQNTAIYLRMLKALFGWAVDIDILPKNPFRKVDFEPEDRPIVVFTDDEVEKILAACNPKLRDQCQFLLLTGFRLDESCQLTWDLVDFDSGVIRHHNQKGKRWSPYPLRAALLSFMKTLPKTYSPYVFGYQLKSSVDHEFIKVLRSINLVTPKGTSRTDDFSIHTFKKTYVSRLIKSKEYSQTDVHFLAHHKDFATTLKYYTWFDVDNIKGKQDAADEAALLRLKAKQAALDSRETIPSPRTANLRLVRK